MGAADAASILLANWVDSAQSFVQVFTLVYFLLIFGYILMSWVRMPYSIWMNRIQRFLYDVVEPYLRIFRRFIPQLGPLDISPIVAIFVLWIVSGLVIRVLGEFGSAPPGDTRLPLARDHAAQRPPPPHQGFLALARRSAASGLVLATQKRGSITWRSIMGLAPTEIRHIPIPRGLRGYRRGAVEQLLDEIAGSYEDVWRDRAELSDRIEYLEEELQRHRELESLLRKTLVSAEAAAEEQREQARRSAELVVSEAHAEARRITFAATAERERLLKDVRRLRELLRTALATVDETEGVDETPDEAAAA